MLGRKRRRSFLKTRQDLSLSLVEKAVQVGLRMDGDKGAGMLAMRGMSLDRAPEAAAGGRALSAAVLPIAPASLLSCCRQAIYASRLALPSHIDSLSLSLSRSLDPSIQCSSLLLPPRAAGGAAASSSSSAAAAVAAAPGVSVRSAPLDPHSGDKGSSRTVINFN